MLTLSRRRARHGAAALAATALLAVAAAPASAAPVDDALDWLVAPGQLTSGDHYVTSYDSGSGTASYDDVGLTIDGNLAIRGFQIASGTSGYATERAATASWIQSSASGYVGGGSCSGASGEVYAGPTAKLTVFRQANALTAPVSELECLQATSGADTGRFRDQSAFGDFSNTFGQSLGIIALRKHYGSGGSTSLTDATDYLLDQQCTNGSFAGAFRSTLGGAPSSCNATSGSPNQVDVDATALAAQALIAAGETTAGQDALDWLQTQQQTGSGSERYWRSGACGTLAASVNSTALAVSGYVADGRGVSGPQLWLTNQVDPTDGWMPGCSSADSDIQRSNRVRATTQGVVGLAGVSFPAIAGI